MADSNNDLKIVGETLMDAFMLDQALTAFEHGKIALSAAEYSCYGEKFLQANTHESLKGAEKLFSLASDQEGLTRVFDQYLDNNLLNAACKLGLNKMSAKRRLEAGIMCLAYNEHQLARQLLTSAFNSKDGTTDEAVVQKFINECREQLIILAESDLNAGEYQDAFEIYKLINSKEHAKTLGEKCMLVIEKTNPNVNALAIDIYSFIDDKSLLIKLGEQFIAMWALTFALQVLEKADDEAALLKLADKLAVSKDLEELKEAKKIYERFLLFKKLEVIADIHRQSDASTLESDFLIDCYEKAGATEKLSSYAGYCIFKKNYRIGLRAYFCAGNAVQLANFITSNLTNSDTLTYRNIAMRYLRELKEKTEAPKEVATAS